MTRQTQIIVIISIALALFIGWFARGWFLSYQLERRVDLILDQFGDQVIELEGDDGIISPEELIGFDELIDLQDTVINTLPTPIDIENNSQTSCSYGRFTFEPGESYFNGCNWCTCEDNGFMLCTERSCEEIQCEKDGVPLVAGESFNDGCNWCTCQDDGTVLCTERACEAE